MGSNQCLDKLHMWVTLLQSGPLGLHLVMNIECPISARFTTYICPGLQSLSTPMDTNVGAVRRQINIHEGSPEKQVPQKQMQTLQQQASA